MLKLFAEIYYLDNNFIHIIKIENDNIQSKISELKSTEQIGVTNAEFGIKWDEISRRVQLFPFFYSIVTNYSFYGFNSIVIGIWIKSFFHKKICYNH